MDFQDAEARTVAERRRAEERQRKLERIYKERVETACREMEGNHHLCDYILLCGLNVRWFSFDLTLVQHTNPVP